MKTAEIFLTEGFLAAKANFNWPFYSVLIAFFSKTTGLSIITSTYIINTFLQLLIVLAFIHIFKKLNPTKSQLYFACFTILFFPQLNAYRAEIIRDFGYYAFSLWGLYHLLNYSKNLFNKFALGSPKSFSIIAYYVCFALAVLFRTEAIVLLLTLPLGIILLDASYKIKFKKLFYFYSPLFIVSLGLIICILFIYLFNSFVGQHLTLRSHLYANIKGIFYYVIKMPVLQLLNDTYSQKMSVVNTSIFNITHNDKISTIAFLWFGLLPVAVIKYIKVLNIINIFFLGIFINKFNTFKNQLHPSALRMILFAIVINILIPTSFLYLIFVTTGRYYLLCALLMLLFVPFGMDYLWQKVVSIIKTNKKPFFPRIIFPLLSLSLFIGLILNSFSSYNDASKQHLKQAGLWYKNQNFPSKQVLSNNPQLAYFAGLDKSQEIEYDNLNLQLINKKQFDYILLRFKPNDNIRLNDLQELISTNQIRILKTFSNKKKDMVYICQLK